MIKGFLPSLSERAPVGARRKTPVMPRSVVTRPISANDAPRDLRYKGKRGMTNPTDSARQNDTSDIINNRGLEKSSDRILLTFGPPEFGSTTC